MKFLLTIVGPFNLAIQRAALSIVAMVLIIYAQGKSLPKDRKTVSSILILGALNAVAIVAQYVALQFETSGISAVLFYTQPLFVFCLSLVLLRGEVRKTRLVGGVLGFLGVVLLTLSQLKSFGGIEVYAVAILLTGAFFWALTIIYYKQKLTHVDPASVNVLQQVMMILVVPPFGLMFEGFSLPISGVYVLLLLYLAILGSGVAQNLWFWLLKEEDVTVVAFSSFLIPLTAVMLGWVFLAEQLAVLPILGIMMILVGIYLVHQP